MTALQPGPIAFGHVGLQVTDVERSCSYYRDIIGLAEMERTVRAEPYLQQVTGYAGVELHVVLLVEPRSGVILELLEYRNVPRAPVDASTANPGTAHLCFQVEDVDGAYDRAVVAGYRAVNPPVTPTSGRWLGGRSVYLLDPDDIRVELVQVASGPAEGTRDPITPALPAGVAIDRIYVIEARFVADAAERRQPYRAAHLKRLADLKRRGIVIESGAYLDELSSSLLLIKESTEAAARQVAMDDVYVATGVWDRVDVRPFGRIDLLGEDPVA